MIQANLILAIFSPKMIQIPRYSLMDTKVLCSKYVSFFSVGKAIGDWNTFCIKGTLLFG
jgi:hypothetical protein